jgi:hypothetical protein
MDQNRAVAKALRDLIAAGLVSEECSGEVRIALNQVYAAGWEEARHGFAERTEKKVMQYDSEGCEIGEDPSIEKAAKRMKCSRETIARAIKTGRHTVKGHTWKFAEDEKST